MTQEPIARMIRHLFRRVWPIVLVLALGLGLDSAGCNTSDAPATASVDRANPEAVIRAYFDAWERGDWEGQAAFMDGNYADMVPEPLESIRVLAIRPLGDPSTTRRVYAVSFDIKVKGQPVSMESGHYDWTYELTWDNQQGSWLITNYGAG
jgi:Domain of unknown function (DUF4829)